MITDEERREVAQELRKRQGSIGQDEDSRELTKWDDLAAIVLIPEQFSACMRFRNQHNRTQAIRSVIAGRLADLIEPGSSATPPRRVTDASATVGASQMEQLLALADELEAEGLDGWVSGPVDVGRYVRRIREALGATEDE